MGVAFFYADKTDLRAGQLVRRTHPENDNI
jgi:hypothetical protein